MNDTYLPAIDVPLLPEHFKGRQSVVDPICERLRQRELLSSQVVGGPKSGKTSLLRYLASELADPALGSAANVVRIYVDAVALGPQDTTAQFWMLACRELKNSPTGATLLGQDAALGATLAKALERSSKGALDIFDLQDLFDGFAAVKRPVVLLVDEFDTVIANAHFLPPAEFFNQVRNLCNRSPRGLAFVVTTGRPLSDVAATAAGPSPFYNQFGTIVLGPLSEEDIRTQLEWLAQRSGVALREDAWREVALASLGQPMLASHLACQMVQALATDASFEQQLRTTISDPDGPFVRLNQAILAALNAREQQAVQTWLTDPNAVTDVQRALLQRLRKFALLPPSVTI
jgi:AAA domain